VDDPRDMTHLGTGSPVRPPFELCVDDDARRLLASGVPASAGDVNVQRVIAPTISGVAMAPTAFAIVRSGIGTRAGACAIVAHGIGCASSAFSCRLSASVDTRSAISSSNEVARMGHSEIPSASSAIPPTRRVIGTVPCGIAAGWFAHAQVSCAIARVSSASVGAASGNDIMTRGKSHGASARPMASGAFVRARRVIASVGDAGAQRVRRRHRFYTPLRRCRGMSRQRPRRANLHHDPEFR
jgi:hypothetical protein